MLLGGLRAAEVRSLRLAEVDMGMRRLRVTGKGGRERVVPVDGAFFAELAAYLRKDPPAGCRTPECFVVLRGPTTGQPLTEAGLRRIFRDPPGVLGGAASTAAPAASYLRYLYCLRPCEGRGFGGVTRRCLTDIRGSPWHVSYVLSCD